MPTSESLTARSEHFKGNCYQRLVDDLWLSGKAKRTVYGYVRAVQKLVEFQQKSPERFSESEVRQFLLHLIVELEVAAGTQGVILSRL